MKQERCEFCYLRKKERIFYSDDKIVAFLAKDAVGPGQSLVIPKEHVENISELEYDMICRIFSLCKLVSRALVEVFHADGVNIICNNGEYAGQTVSHLHIHVVPRFRGDVVNSKLWLNQELFDRLYEPTTQDFERMVAKIRKQMKPSLSEVCNEAE